MIDDSIPGSRWWRFDFHNHTPASSDYDAAERQTLQPREWLLAYMRAGVDAVAVTDHNTAEWVERLQTALGQLDIEKPAGWAALALFPGAEISTHDSLHILALFGPGTPKKTLDGLLHGRLTGWRDDKPNHEQQCAQSAVDVIAAVHAAGGIAIPAHVDKVNGLFFGHVDGAGCWLPKVSPRSIEDVLRAADALDLHDAASPAARHFADALAEHAVVSGSDAPHHTRNAGQRTTWIKMSRPDLAGLRLAQLDPECAVRPAVPRTWCRSGPWS